MPVKFPRKVVEKKLFNLNRNKPKHVLPEYTDEWIDAYIQFLTNNRNWCITTQKHCPEEDVLMFRSIETAYNEAIDRLLKVDFI